MGSKVELQFDGKRNLYGSKKWGPFWSIIELLKLLRILELFSAELKSKLDDIEYTNEIAYSSMIWHLSDNIVRHVDEAKIARALWTVLDTMFLTKT